MDESKIIMKGRLGPGMMITVDLQSGQVIMPFPVVALIIIYLISIF